MPTSKHRRKGRNRATPEAADLEKRYPKWLQQLIADRVFSKIDEMKKAHRQPDSDALLEELAADNAAEAADVCAQHADATPELQRKYSQQQTLKMWGLIVNLIEKGYLPPFKREHLQESSNLN